LTEALPRFEQVLTLGRKLVDELGMEPPVDTLGRWMAHYIAQLIDAAANAQSEERPTAQKRCFDMILELWSHHAELPNGKRPFENLEPIIRAIESLDPADEIPRFFRTIRDRIVEEDEEAETQSLLEFVGHIDSTAKIVIGYVLSEAARSAADKSKEWVLLVENAGVGWGAHDIVLRFASGKANLETTPDPNEHEREQLQNRIKRLEAFTNVAVRVCEDFKERLEALPPPQE
jgi:hypothetical protein